MGLNTFVLNQLVYLEIYQSLSYGKQKVQIIINRILYGPCIRSLRSISEWI